jgi:hypothetical protein
VDYLQKATRTVTVDVNDRHQRWGAFLELCGPAGREMVIAHLDGTRWVRPQWFYDFARACDRNAGGNAQIATRMERVGWLRRGSRGRVKATDPSGRRAPIIHSFFDVPAGWEEGQELR